jgi:hypothetical protein
MTNIIIVEYPEYMFAIISSFLPSDGDEGAKYLRKFTGKVVIKYTDKNGFTYKNGALHSYNDLPAIINGCAQSWYKDGMFHRDGDLPAYVNPLLGLTEWYKYGVYHRDGDLPAGIDVNRRGTVYRWFKHGKRHRDGGKPAIDDEEYSYRQWWVQGILIKSEYDYV